MRTLIVTAVLILSVSAQAQTSDDTTKAVRAYANVQDWCTEEMLDRECSDIMDKYGRAEFRQQLLHPLACRESDGIETSKVIDVDGKERRGPFHIGQTWVDDYNGHNKTKTPIKFEDLDKPGNGYLSLRILNWYGTQKNYKYVSLSIENTLRCWNGGPDGVTPAEGIADEKKRKAQEQELANTSKYEGEVSLFSKVDKYIEESGIFVVFYF